MIFCSKRSRKKRSELFSEDNKVKVGEADFKITCFHSTNREREFIDLIYSLRISIAWQLFLVMLWKGLRDLPLKVLSVLSPRLVLRTLQLKTILETLLTSAADLRCVSPPSAQFSKCTCQMERDPYLLQEAVD